MSAVSQKTEVILELSRLLNAPPQLVFDVWTTPEHISQWFKAKSFYQTRHAQMDCRDGGRYRLEMFDPHEDIAYIVVGEFLQVIKPQKITCTWTWKSPPGGAKNALLTVEFRPLENKTELILRHDLPSPKSAENHYKGWIGCLDQLEYHLGELV